MNPQDTDKLSPANGIIRQYTIDAEPYYRAVDDEVLLFEPAYCRALIALGYKDTMARREEVLKFISGAPLRASASQGAEGGIKGSV